MLRYSKVGFYVFLLVSNQIWNISLEITRSSKTRQALFRKIFQDKYLQDPHVIQHTVDNFGECAHLCLQRTSCKSINFRATATRQDCHLVTKDWRESTVSEFIEEAGWKYYDTSISSCKDALLFNNFKSGFYIIYPALVGLTAYCFMSNGKYSTNMTHDWNLEKYVTDKESCPSTMPNIQYQGANGIESIIQMVDQSDSCEQHVKVRCIDAQPYLSRGRTSACIGVRDRNGNHVGYWGGGNPQKYCACGVTGTCYNNANECNCESTTSTLEQMDEGTFTDKNILPITSVAPGDTGGGLLRNSSTPLVI